MTTIAYSYVRFSSKKQEEGDSLRRQTEGAKKYCKRRGWKLDTTLSSPDLGVSAFKGKNALVGNLKTFLDAVKSGKVVPGSVLIVESIDRISRQGIDEGYDLIKGILKAGIKLVTFSPEREFDRDATRSLSKGALEIQLILERAAEESERKSERVGAAWAEKREQARGGIRATRRLPAWVKVEGEKLVPIPKRAAIIKQIFHLAANGYGIGSILSKLSEEGTPAIGKSGRWGKAFVAIILKDRRAVGEYHPRKNGKRIGEPIPGYYPAVVTEAEFLAARGGMAVRQKNSGRIGKAQINIFAGLLRNAREGDSYIMVPRISATKNGPKKYQILTNTNAYSGEKSRAYSLPYLVFEQAVLTCLREITPNEILVSKSSQPNEILNIEDQLEGIDAELLEASAYMEAHGFSATIGKRVTGLEAKKLDLAAKLADAQHKAATPLSEAWREAKSLLEVFDRSSDPQDTRLRLRAALRRIVESMFLLIVARGRTRVACLQINFRDGKRRDYLLQCWPAGNCREAGWQVRSWLKAEVFPLSKEDLRDPDGTGAVSLIENWLEKTPLELLFPKPAPSRKVVK